MNIGQKNKTNKKCYGGKKLFECLENIFAIARRSYLVCVQDFQEGFIDIRLTLEAVFDFVDIVDGMVEFHWLVVLERRPTGRRAADGSVGLNCRRSW